MTCVVGLVEGGDVWIGADSAAYDSDSMNLTVRKDPKVFALGNAFLVGFCDSFRQGQAIRYHFAPPKHLRRVSVDQYMNTSFIDALRKVLQDRGIMAKKDNVEETAG